MFEEARHRAEHPPAEGRSGRRRADRAVGADGHDRDGAADRVRQRRQPAAGASRIAPAGAGDSRGARRRLGPDRARAAARERDARHRSAASSASASPSARCALLVALAPGEPAAARGHRARRAGAAVHARRSPSSPACCSERSRCSSTPAPQLGDDAARRRPNAEREQGAPSRAQHARRRAGRAGARAAGQLGLDDPDVSGVAGRASRDSRGPTKCRRCGCRFPDSQVKEPEAVMRMQQAIIGQDRGGARRDVGRARVDRAR